MKTKKGLFGFTIVEVMIVLAIGALILTIVFLAVPSLERSSRNTQRNDDSYKVLSAVNECSSNNNGDITQCLPSNGAGNYITSGGPILSSGGYLDTSKLRQLTTIRLYTPTSTPGYPAAGVNDSAYVFSGYSCSTTSPYYTNNNVGANQFVVLFNRELASNGSSNACVSP